MSGEHRDQRIEQRRGFGQERDVVEVPIGERRAVEALRRRAPAEFAAQPVEVVVASVGLDRRLGRDEALEHLTIEYLGLERLPEGLDLAVRSGCADRGPDVADGQFVEGALEAAEHGPDDGHEGRPVVGHQLERHAAQLDRLSEQVQDRLGLTGWHGADAEQVAGVIVDQPGEVTAALPVGAAEVEGALEVDVPQLVRRRALKAWAGLPRRAWAVRPGPAQDAGGLPVAQQISRLVNSAARRRLFQ